MKYESVAEVAQWQWNTIQLFDGKSPIEDNILVILFLNTLKYKNIAFKIKKDQFLVLDQDILQLDFIKFCELQVNAILRRWNIYNSEGILKLLDEKYDADKALIEENFGEFFELLIGKIHLSRGRRSGMDVLPNEISELAIKLVDLDNDSKVYNPFAGYASFGMHLKNNVSYLGQELLPNNVIIGGLRLMAHDKSTEQFRVEMEDSISNWNSNGDTFDLIIANPPFGYKLSKNNYDVRYASTAEDFVVDRGVEALKSDGKLIAIVSGNFLSSNRNKSLRKRLVEDNLLSTVIMFPDNLLLNTSIPFAILILDANKQDRNIKMVDASSYVELSNENRLNRYRLITSKLLAEIKKTELQDKITLVSNSVVKKQEYSLNVRRYFTLDFEGVALSELLTPIQSKIQRVNKMESINDKVKYIGVKQLKADPLDYFLNADQLSLTNHPNQMRLINEPCLLLVNRNNQLKPTYVNTTKSGFFISLFISAFRVNFKKVDLDYLINQLHADYVKKQLSGLYTSLYILSMKDILSIKIKLPDLETQRSEVKGFKVAYSQEQKRELDLFNKIHGLESELVNQNAFLRHTLAGPISNILDAMQNLNAIINDKVVIDLPDVLNFKRSDKHIYNLGDYLKFLEDDINKVHQTISKRIDAGSVIHEKDLVPFDVVRFCQRYVQRIISKADTTFEFDLQIDESSLMDKNGNLIYPKILANKDLFKDMLDNLLDNAKKYGFQNNGQDKIEFFISSFHHESAKSQFMILFSNTGNPLPENFSHEEFIRKGGKFGDKPGDGFGGWYIHEIVKRFNGDLNIIDETGLEGLGFSYLATSFEISFPIHLEDEE